MTARAPGEPVAAFLARLRKEIGLRESNTRGAISQEEAARRAGVTREQWNRWENRTQLSPQNAARVAAAFELRTEDLLVDPTGEKTLSDRVAALEEEAAALREMLRLAHQATETLTGRVEGLERRRRGRGAADASSSGGARPR